jgi:2-polyprenyl-3-methyl-5-hydroxy-6-metoxy-1,4-benzoquinol methylase
MGVTREAIIADCVKGKKVLDVGCVGNAAHGAVQPDWLHRLICEHAAEVVGLDIAAEAVALLREQGHKIICGDAETADLGRTFDCIIAAELIEHLSNAGLFFANMRRHLEPGGTLLVTTPNPFYPFRSLGILLRGATRVNPQHTCWYCPRTLENALARAGYQDVDVRYVNYTARFWGLAGFPRHLRRWFCTNILALARKPQ